MCATGADLTVSHRAAREPTESNKNTQTGVNGNRQRTIEVKHQIHVHLLVGTTAADGIMRESDSWVYLSNQKVRTPRAFNESNKPLTVLF